MHAYRISVQQSQCSALVMQSEANHAVPGIIVIRNGVRTRFMDQRQDGGVKYALLPSGAHDPLRADFAQPSSYTSSKLRDGALVSLGRIDLSTEFNSADRDIEASRAYNSL